MGYHEIEKIEIPFQPGGLCAWKMQRGSQGRWAPRWHWERSLGKHWIHMYVLEELEMQYRRRKAEETTGGGVQA